MKRILLFCFSTALIVCLQAQDLISGGSNSWIFHTPDDGRTTMFIAPKNNSPNWDFSKQTQFLSNGDIITTGVVNLPRITGLSSGNLVINAYDGGGGNGYGIEFYAVQNGFNFKTFAGNWYSRFFIDDNGNVGIGTTNPSSKLDVNGNIAISATSNPILDFTSNDNAIINRKSGKILHLTEGYSSSQLVLQSGGNVGIRTSTPSNKLEVNGTIRSTEVKVEASPWPDYVFEEDYDSRSLEETEAYIKANKHLPEIPSAEEIETNGLALGEMNALLLKKIEELTLYQIEMMKIIKKQHKEIEKLQKALK